MRLRPWVLWSTKTKIACGVAVLAVVGGTAAYYAELSKESIFPAVAAAIAIGALFVTAFSSFSTFERAKKKDTLEAWNAWSDGTREARRRVTKLLGEENMTEEQGKALVGAPNHQQQLVGKDEPLADKERDRVREDVRDILNGLERLAVGVLIGIYDLAVLQLMGATIIARLYERFEPFIVALRDDAAPKKTRQTKALVSLTTLYEMIYTGSLEDRKKAVDRARTTALKHQ